MIGSLKENCINWIKEWFEENGKGCNAVIGISGGKDSSIVAALCVEALGRNRVIGVLMPNGEQADIEDSLSLVNHLGIKYIEANIEGAYKAVLNELDTLFVKEDTGWFPCNFEASEQTKINLPPRLRMATLYAVAQSFNGRVANTCNLSEDYIGYSTRWGDSVGDFSPIANLTTDEVIAIGDELGLPECYTHKTPSDGLCGKSDEEKFGFTYEQLNKYIKQHTCGDKEIDAKIRNMHEQNLFKLLPIQEFDPYL